MAFGKSSCFYSLKHFNLIEGISRWKELDQIEPGNARMRYFAAAEARNNFIAAAQNVQSC